MVSKGVHANIYTGQFVRLPQTEARKHLVEPLMEGTHSKYATSPRTLQSGISHLVDMAPLVWPLQPLWKQIGFPCVKVLQNFRRSRASLFVLRTTAQDCIEAYYHDTLHNQTDGSVFVSAF